MDLSQLLTAKKRDGRIPTITAYHRIDGPGSSLDLREFQAAFWKNPDCIDELDKTFQWSAALPRTVGITIDTGCIVEAHPCNPGKIGVASADYGYYVEFENNLIPFARRNWLAKAIHLTGLTGVKFVVKSLKSGTKSSGLGGSATATTAVCLLANRLAETSLGGHQIIGMASLLEQDMGVSITGTQEQANVVYGGVTDYVWFPWGIPGQNGGLGSSVRRTLMSEDEYDGLSSRLRIYHSGSERESTDVNSVWRKKLSEEKGYETHAKKLKVAYEFSEGIRRKDWMVVADAIQRYAAIRTKLCPKYMSRGCWAIQEESKRHGAESFPLGAGGGGAVLVFSPDPDRLTELDASMLGRFRRLEFVLKPKGHVFADTDGLREPKSHPEFART